MDRGWIKLHRKIIDSHVFSHPGLLKLWVLCMTKATHKEIEVSVPGLLEPVNLKPGQFITGRDSLHYEYHQGHIKNKYSRKLKPTAITLYRWLKTLEKTENLNIKTCTKFSIITVSNWPTYQGSEQRSEQQGEHQMNTNKNNQEEITPEVFSSLRKRYDDQELIDRAFDAIRSTRKSGKVADSVLVAQLRKWDRYPVGQVEAGIKIYLDKDYASQGKREDYLYGIIRNQTTETSKLKTWKDELSDL